MQESDHIKNLISMSHEVGKNLAYVQGGGGNTSVKINDKYMYIKASGISLKDMTLESGLAKVNFANVNNYHLQPDESEDEYNEAINNFSLTPNKKPSIETGFHAILGKYVIHSHSIFLNVFLCSKEGQDILLKYFPNALWINYFTPGKDLTAQISKTIAKKTDNFEGLIFLQNHGVIASASSYKSCLKLHSDSNKKIKSVYKLDKFELVKKTNFSIPSNFLFPDQVIYMSKDEIQKNSQALHETVSAVDYIENTIKKLSLRPNYLSNRDINILNHMQSEKYRKNLSK